MKISTILASGLTAVLVFCQCAFAQIRGAPITPPKTPLTKQVTPAAPASGQMELLCRDPGSVAGLAANSVLHYERISLRDASGELKTIYVPTRAAIQLRFTPATEPVKGRGETLARGSCGLRTSVIAAVAGVHSLELVVSDPQSFSLGIHGQSADDFGRAGFSTNTAFLGLPDCPSGVRAFTVNRSSPTLFFADFYPPPGTACVE